MALGNSVTSIDSILKEYYSDGSIADAIYTDNPFLAMVAKNENSTGRHHNFTIITGAGQARSGSFARAQANAALTSELFSTFQVTLKANHAVATVSSDAIDESSNDQGSFLRIVTQIGDNQLQNLSNDLAYALYRTSDRNRGQIATTTTLASSTLKLASPQDALGFEVGMELDLAAAKSTGNVRAYGSGAHGLYVTAVDMVAGTITVGTSPVPNGTACNITDAVDGIPTAATGDYIFVRGDRGAGINGIADWIPYGGVASNDSFNGVNRSSQPVRLAGLYHDASSGGSIAATLETAAANVGQQGGKLTHFLMSYRDFARLSIELGTKAQLVDMKVGNVGFSGINVIGATGPIACLPDRNVPSATCFGINKSAWELISVNKAVKVWDEDGKTWLRSAADSGMEIRFRSFCQLKCIDPRQNINIKMPV